MVTRLTYPFSSVHWRRNEATRHTAVSIHSRLRCTTEFQQHYTDIVGINIRTASCRCPIPASKIILTRAIVYIVTNSMDVANSGEI